MDGIGGIDRATRDYIDAIDAAHRPLFDRLHRLILAERPDAEVVLSYSIPTYKVGRRRLYLGVWKHGLSVYGWNRGDDAGFAARHPELMSGRGTIQLRPEVAADIPDDEFRDLFRSALAID
ncbi:MAG TPA: DUF1801 domain-containing protein [Pseudonocardiaceae bacterium]|jgi:hypothetical protein|nr:DUF1801 domain-containing protein [Pseudonocardiaceae bacterium]